MRITYILLLFLFSDGILFSQEFVTFTPLFTDYSYYYYNHSSSASWADVDGDGDPDLFVTNGEAYEPCELYINLGPEGFRQVQNNVTNRPGPSFGACFGDYDNDGDLDLYIARADYQEESGLTNYLYANRGNGVFVPVDSGPPVEDEDPSYAASWVDYNMDGWPDLFVANAYNKPNRLYRNKGDGTFERITSGPITTDLEHNIGCVWSDYDLDGDPDLVTVSPSGEPIQFYRNENGQSFTRLGISDLGIEYTNTCRSASWRDFDNDGWPDLILVAADEENRLYRNEEGSGFSVVSAPDFDSSAPFSGNGAAWGDFDNDGDADLIIMHHFEQLKEFHQNQGDGTFRIVSTDLNDITYHITYALAPADFDSDGRLDLFQANRYQVGGGNFPAENVLWRNTNSACTNFAGISLRGEQSNTFGLGARVSVYIADEEGGESKFQMQEMQSLSGGGYTAQSGYRLHFGLGEAAVIDSVQVDWPSGLTSVYYQLPVNQHLILRENGEMIAEKDPYGLQILPIRDSDCPGRVSSLEAFNSRGGIRWYIGSPESLVEGYGSSLSIPLYNGSQTYYAVDQCGNMDSLEVISDYTESRMYPNPASGILYFSLPSVQGAPVAFVDIYDVWGRKVLESQLDVLEGYNQLEINISGLAAGTYFVEIKSACFEAVERLIVIH